MNKNLIFRLLSYILLLLAPIFWLLGVLMPDTFGWYNLSVAFGFVFAGLGFIVIAKNALLRRFIAFKRIGLFVATIFEIIALICFVVGFTLPKNIVAPIICIIIAVMLIIGLLLTAIGPKAKWDEGDNHKEGYKNYYERKEEQKQEQQNDNIEIIIEDKKEN